MTQTYRVSGSGYTIFTWNGTLIASADNVTVNAVRPVAPAMVIQPLNARRPIEIAVPAAHTEGTITLTLKDLYGKSVWDRLAVISGSNDIVDIMNRMAALENPVQIMKIVRHPNGTAWSETFFGCMVSDIDDSETINIGSMVLDKTLTIMYTYSKKSWRKSPNYVDQNPFVTNITAPQNQP